jgi:hypothetical protein
VSEKNASGYWLKKSCGEHDRFHLECPKCNCGNATFVSTANDQTVPREVADRLAEACETEHLQALLQYIGGGSCQCDYETGAAPCEKCVAARAETRIANALNAYRQSGPPCPGCCGTEPASPQSWRCQTHMLAESLARVAELEEALQMIVNTHDADTLAGEIARKALKVSS